MKKKKHESKDCALGAMTRKKKQKHKIETGLIGNLKSNWGSPVSGEEGYKFKSCSRPILLLFFFSDSYYLNTITEFYKSNRNEKDKEILIKN